MLRKYISEKDQIIRHPREIYEFEKQKGRGL
jgi:hypothetical protein